MKNFFYRVQKGDSLFSVSLKFHAPATVIIKENNLTCEIEEGDVLFITPKEKFYFVDLNENYRTISDKCNVLEEELKNINRLPFLYYGLTIEIL